MFAFKINIYVIHNAILEYHLPV